MSARVAVGGGEMGSDSPKASRNVDEKLCLCGEGKREEKKSGFKMYAYAMPRQPQ